MSRVEDRQRYKLTKSGKVVLVIILIALFFLGFMIGKSLFTDNQNDVNNDVNNQQQEQTAGDAAQGDAIEDNKSMVIVSPAMTYDEQSLAGLDTKAIGWGFGHNVNENNRPHGSLNAQANYGKYDADFIAPETKTVYLTIDEGYENGYTAKILDVLKEKDCPAVFFVTMPYVKSNPDLVQRMIDEGHVVGNHSVTHPTQGLPSQTIAEQANELKELHQYVLDNFGYEMYLFRYPAGIYSEQSLALVQQMGYRSVFWSYAYRDWETDNQPDPTESLQKLNDKMHDGAIYLLHAVSATNTEIMGQFIDDTRAKGYTFAVYPQVFEEVETENV